MNIHENHKEINYINDDGDIKSEAQIKKIATNLIKLNLKEPISFHINNLKNNKINLKKSTIRNLLYSLREETFPRDDDYLKNINDIKIVFPFNELTTEQNYCIAKGEFINFKKNNKLEKYVIFLRIFS